MAYIHNPIDSVDDFSDLLKLANDIVKFAAKNRQMFVFRHWKIGHYLLMLPYLKGNPVRTILSHNDQKPTISRRVSFIFRSLPNTKEINMEEKKENVMD